LSIERRKEGRIVERLFGIKSGNFSIFSAYAFSVLIAENPKINKIFAEKPTYISKWVRS